MRDLSLENLNLILIIIIIVFSTFNFYKSLRNRNISMLFYGYYFIIFGIMQLLANLSGFEFDFSILVRLKANIVAFITLLAWFIGELIVYSTAKVTRKVMQMRCKNEDALFKGSSEVLCLGWVCMFLAFLGFVILVINKDIPFFSLFSYETRTVYRMTGNPMVVTLASFLISLVMVSNYISILQRNKILFYLGSIFTFLYIALGGIRAYLFYIFGPLLYYILNTYSKRKLSFKLLLFLCIGGILFAILFEGIHLWRWQEKRNFLTLARVLSDKNTYLFIFTDPKSELNYRLRLFQSVEIFPDKHDWLYGNTYKNVLLFWIPSGLLKGAKIDTMYIFADLILGTSSSYLERASIQPTFPGDCYINFGYLFWIIPMIWGAFITYIQIKARSNIILNLIIGSCIVYFLALSLRGSVYLAIYQLIMNAVFIFLLYNFIKFSVVKKT